MQRRIILLAALVFLSSCTANEEAQDQVNKQSVDQEVQKVQEMDAKENAMEEPAELSEEEKLAKELPEEAGLEDWNLLLVGPDHPLPEDFELSLVEVDNEQRIDEKIEDAWYSWKEAALEAGHRLFFASGYRSVAHQRANFNNTYERYVNEGYSEEEALDKTKEYLTEPGHSEHHTGLALDIVDEEWIVAGNGLTPDYDTQDSQQWLVNTMADYGFILRYPAGKEEITGIKYESWHFRYVGEENAQFIAAHDLALEEYIELLEIREELEANSVKQ